MTAVKVKGGLILLDKPAEITSFRVLAVVKDALKIKKVGHAGTLDKFATGLLLILTGPYTRLVPYFTNLDKEYLATFRFGIETTTLDPEGESVHTGPVPSREEIDAVLGQFKGTIQQVPPLYSAVHYQGQRAYELANKGAAPDLKSRSIHIEQLEILSYAAPALTLHIRCSKGTYIRALARDLGRACGSCAFVTSLRRTASGPFTVAEAVTPADFNPAVHLRAAQDFLPLLGDIRIQTVVPAVEQHVLQGRPLLQQYLDFEPRLGERVAIFSQDGQLIALAEYQALQAKTKSYRYLAVFNRLDD